MKNYTHKIVGLSVGLSLVASPFLALASDAAGGAALRLNTGISTGAQTETTGTTSAKGGVNVNVGATTDVVSPRDTASGQASGKVVSPRDSASGQATGKSILEADLPGDGELDAAVSVRGWDTSEKKEIVVRTKTESRATTSASTRENASVRIVAAGNTTIQSVDDLQLLVEAVVEADPNIKLIKLVPTETEVDYSYRGRLFGVIPVRPILRATVDGKGEVRVKYPWYEMFVRRTTVVADADLSSETKAKLAGVDPALRLDTQAKAVVALSNVLKAKHEVSVTTTGSSQ